MRTFLLAFAFWAFPAALLAQFSTPALDATLSAGEYGVHSDGQNQQTSNGNVWYMTWDDTYLYVAVQGSWNPNVDAINLFLDVNPVVPVNGTNSTDGSLTGPGFDQVQAELPFRADYFLFIKSNYNEWRTSNGADGWSTGTAFSIAFSAGAGILECRIPWTTITGAGRPAAFNWTGYLSYDNGGNNGAFSPVPTGNPAVAGAGPLSSWIPYYYSITNTNDGTPTKSFLWTSLAYRQDNSAAGTGGFVLNPGTYWDLTVNDNSPDNTDNTSNSYIYNNGEYCNRVLLNSGIFSLYGDIYIGPGSALLPADNTSGNVTAIIQTYNEVNLTNYGRLDCVPELDVAGDEDNRRLTFTVIDTLTIMPSNGLPVGLYRFGDVNIAMSGVMQASSLANTNTPIEFELCTIDNNGKMDFVGPNGSTVDVYTRGFMPGQDNVVYLTSSSATGSFLFHKLLIGTDVGYLRPVATAAPLTINLMENLEIYSNLITRDGTGIINFAFIGDDVQYIRGSVGETSEPVVGIPNLPVEVVFQDLTIQNNNGLGNNNAGADILFESYNNAGYGNIDYLIEGTLTMLSGDIVTRDRTAPNGQYAVHNLTLMEGGAVDASGAVSDVGGNPSCFIDGPFRREVATAALSAEVFPIGKSANFFGVDVGDYRRMVLQVDQAAATSNVYVAEMFLGDRSGTYTWPNPTPELIVNISNIRYWNLISTDPAMTYDQLVVSLDYSDQEYDDAVPAAAGLRIVKDDGAGQWYNLQQLGPGGTATPSGSITSFDITGMPISLFGDMTLANIDGFFNPLQSSMINLEAALENGSARLNWETSFAPETDFDILRSRGDDFEVIGQVSNAAHSNASFVDADLLQGTVWYRIRTKNLLGQMVYSNIVELSIHSFGIKLIQADHHWTLIRTMEGADAELSLWDMAGKNLGKFAWDSDVQMMNISTENMAPGMYLIRVNDGKASKTIKAWVK
ncbi:MAG: hypothetical protein NWR72_17745 [Bacteroidia bacterium]|nr:hypothetical protein [Bacteroidia bacterium]